MKAVAELGAVAVPGICENDSLDRERPQLDRVRGDVAARCLRAPESMEGWCRVSLTRPSRTGVERYRLLQEYFSFHKRFHFVEWRGLGPGVSRCDADYLELIVPLTRYDAALEGELASLGSLRQPRYTPP